MVWMWKKKKMSQEWLQGFQSSLEYRVSIYWDGEEGIDYQVNLQGCSGYRVV